MNPLRVVFFCGSESPYGFAHLQPILDEKRFDTIAVVLASQERWDKFRRALTGDSPTRKKYPFVERYLKNAARNIRILLAKPSLRLLLTTFQKSISRLSGSSKTGEAIKKCIARGVQVWTESDINSPSFLEKLSECKPDLIIGAAYPQIFQKPLLDIPLKGAINSHPSLLPRFRGAHPIFWVLALGEKESGVTFHYMLEKVDVGAIIAQIGFPVHYNDDYNTLYKKTLRFVPDLVRQAADFFDSGGELIKQDESKASFFRGDREIHLAIFWSLYEAEQIRNLVRAANGRAFFYSGRNRVSVSKCVVSKTNRNLTNGIRVPAGTVVDTKDKVTVKVKDGVVTITEWYADNGKRELFKIGQVFS